MSRPRFQLKLLHKGVILVLLPLAIELAFVATLWQLLNSADALTRRLSHAKQVSSELNQMEQLVFEGARQSALNKFIPQPHFRERAAAILKQIDEQTDLIDKLTSGTAEERQAFLHMKPAIQDVELVMEQLLQRAARGEPLTPASLTDNQVIGQVGSVMGRFKDAVGELVQVERDAETQGAVAEAQTRQALMNWIGIGLAFNVAIALGMAVFFYRELLKRLNVLMENTHRVASNRSLLPRISGGDEIEHLDSVFHNMATALKEASEYKKELIAMVSHDLRTPLTAIHGSLELLEAGVCGEMPGKAREEVRVAERNATRLINLINDLLDIEKMDAGKLEMAPGVVNAGVLVERSVEAVTGFAEQHAIKFALPERAFDFTADGDRLVQVLVNLLSNAIKFSPNGGTITLDVVGEPNWIEFRVTDEGPGIPADQRESLFQRFAQAAGVSSTKLKGTGLGLAICKAIVQGHNGEIGFDSKSNSGTTFWFRIPWQAHAAPMVCAPKEADDARV